MTTATQEPTAIRKQSEESILSVRGLETHFFTDEGIVRAVDGVDFDVKPGTTMVSLGKAVAARASPPSRYCKS